MSHGMRKLRVDGTQPLDNTDDGDILESATNDTVEAKAFLSGLALGLHRPVASASSDKKAF